MKKTKGFKIWSAACAMLLAVSCLATMVFIGAAADPDTYTAQSEYVCRIEADDMTNTPPYASAGVTGGFGSEAANGRVWVDKSVSANAASNAFDVTLSALAQEYSYSEEAIQTIMEQNAADVLFVLDFSSSMTKSMDGSTRIKVLASSLNDAMKKIMDANPNNRIMAVAFDAGSYDFLPLGSYGPNSSGNYVEYDSSTKGIKMCSGATKDGAAATYSLPLGSGTHMQIGITYGCNALIQSMNDGYGEESKRMPFVMVMTDGSSSYSNDNWAGYNLANQNNQSNQIEANSTLAATFWKKRLIDAYNVKNAANGFEDSDVNAVWFNIGVGLGDPENNVDTAKRDQVSMKPTFASPDAPSGSVARTIYNNILTRLEKAYNTPEYYVSDPLLGYDDILTRAGIDMEAFRTYVNTKVTDAENLFNEKLANPNSNEAKAIKAAGTKAEEEVLYKGNKDNYTKVDDFHKYVKNTYGLEYNKGKYKGKDAQFYADVEAKVTEAAAKAKSDAEAAEQQKLYDEAVGSAEASAIAKAMEDQHLTTEGLTGKVLDYFNEFVRDYMGYDGATQAERQSKYAEKPMHGFAEYVNYADTAAKVEGSFDDLASLIAAATQGTVIPITHHSTTEAAADEIFITFTDPIGKGTELKTDEDGNYVMSIELNGVTYQGRPKADAAEGVYEFYNETADKTLYSTATISADKVVWEINAYELPIIRFANRMVPGYDPTGKIKGDYYEDPNLAPISVKYEVVPTADALANTATNGNFIYEHDDVATAPAQAVFTPTLANTYYFTNTGSMETPVYEKVTTAIETTVNKATGANKSATAAYVTDSAWGIGDDADDFFILLGNDARTKVLAEVSIEDDRMEDDGDVIAHTYNTDETITYTLKVKNLSDEPLEKLTYTLDVTPSGPAATDTPSALTVGTCSTTPDKTVKTGNKQTLTFTLAELAAGATETVTVPMTPAAGTKNGVAVDAVITLTKVFNNDLVTKATDEVGEVLIAEDATVYTYLDGTKTNLTGISGAPSTLYIKKDGGDYIALTKDTATATYVATNIPIGEYTIYDGNSGTPKALGAVSVTKGGDNEGNLYWKTLTLAKVWDDNNNQDGKRTDVTLTLYRAVGSGDPVKVDDYALTSANVVTGNTNKWQKKYVVIAKDASGNDYTFTLKELEANVPSGYTASADGLTVTNKHTPITDDITITKVWDDAEFVGQGGYERPASISIALTAKVNGTKVEALCKTATLTASDVNPENANEWLYTFEDLPVYNNGQEIAYTVSETTPTGYTSTVDGKKITNTPKDVSDTFNPVELSVSKLDKNTDVGLKGAVFTATATGITNVTGTTDADGQATLKFLKPGTYTVSETTPPTGYKTDSTTYTIVVAKTLKTVAYDSTTEKWVRTYDLSIDTAASATLTDSKLVVKDEPETCSATLKKVWDDNSDQDGKRPDSVTLSLYKTFNGYKKWVQDVKIDKPDIVKNEWLKTVQDLPAYESGYAVTYIADEKGSNVDSNYTKESADGLVVTNKHVPETKEITITKVWNDNHNQDGKRPANVTLTLYKQIEGGEKTSVGNYTFTDTGDSWTKTIENLPVYESGKVITYTADELEANVPANYTKESASGLVVTNKHVPETVSATLKKVWDDNSDQDGKRPLVMKLMLLKKVGDTTSIVDEYELSGDGNEWTKTINDLPKYEGGVEITYLADEDNNKMPSGYAKESASGLVVTNKHAPEVKTISGTKTWDDAEYVGKTGYTRPTITVNLIATVAGVKVDALCKQTTATAAANWEYAFYDVPVYHGGKTVTYTVEESPVDGFTPTVTGDDIENTPDDGEEILKPITLTVKKVDSLTTTGKGLKGAVFTLTDSEGATTPYTTLDDGTVAIEFTKTGIYTLAETTAPTGYQLDTENTYTVTVTKNFVSVALNDVKKLWDWNYDLSYALTGVQDGVLTVKDAPVATEKTTLTKVWDDNANQDGVRPTGVTFALYKTVNGVTTKVQDVTLSGGATAESWTKDVENLPTYEDGYAVTYTIDEDEDQLGDDYSKKSVDNDTLTITNFHKPGVTSATLKKVWADNDDQDGKRPEEVTLTLYKTVNGVTSKLDDYTFDGEGNEWTKKVEDLPKFEDGYTVVYTADELTDNVPTGYEKSAEGLVVTNTHEPETTDVTVTKVWEDNSDQDGKRPADVTLTLYKTVDGDTAKVQDVTFDGEGDEWTKTIEDLPVYEDGFEITYTVDELTDNVPTGYEKSADGLTVTNTHEPETTDVTVTKVWEDNSDQDGKRPADVTLTLYKTVDGDTAKVQDVTFDGEGDEWTKTISDLPVYEDGFEIVYTADETDGNLPEGYEKSADGLTVTNSHEPETTSVTLTKVWADESNVDDTRPADVTLTLYKTVDGETAKVQDVTFGGEGNEWTKTIENLPVYEDGFEIVYTADETDDNLPESYEKSADGLTVTNTRVVERTITVTVEGGTASNGTSTVVYGDDFTTTFTPDEGKVILSVTIDGEEVKITDDITYDFTDITKNHEIVVKFADDKNGNGVPDIFEEQVTYQIENGTWEDGTTDDIVENFVLKELKDGVWTDTNVTLGDTIPTGMTPDEFYTDNGKWNTEITADTAVTTNATYRYTFGEEKTHTVTIDIENGTTDPNQGSFPVKHKDDQDVKITPDEHYVIDKIIVDGEEVEIPEDGTLHFTEIVTDHDIQVICEEDANDDMIADKYQATVTVDMDNEEAGSVSGDGVYWKGETATVTATPSTGYRFIGWELDGEIVSYDPEYTFTADENVRLIALFEKLEVPTEAPTTTTTTTVTPTAPEKAPETGDMLPSAALLLAVAAAGVLFASRKRENEE